MLHASIKWLENISCETMDLIITVLPHQNQSQCHKSNYMYDRKGEKMSCVHKLPGFHRSLQNREIYLAVGFRTPTITPTIIR